LPAIDRISIFPHSYRIDKLSTLITITLSINGYEGCQYPQAPIFMMLVILNFRVSNLKVSFALTAIKNVFMVVRVINNLSQYL
jgi:hypothetical protein